jgi:hypothetical protein
MLDPSGGFKRRQAIGSSRFVVLLVIAVVSLALQITTSVTPSLDRRETTTTHHIEPINLLPQTLQQPIQQGVVLFYHVFKTGGSTIRWNYRRLQQQVDFVRVQSKEQYDNVAVMIDQRLSHNQTFHKPLFVEIHVEAPDASFPTLLDMRPQLLQWNKLARQNNVPMFSFTLVREPLSFAVSFFNMFHAPKNRYSWNPFELLEPTEENLRLSLVQNRQCYILGIRGDGILLRGGSGSIPKPEHCRQVKYMLENDLDWVGTTERMQTETLPLLTHLLLGNSSVGTSMGAFRPSVEPRRALSMTNLTEETKRYIIEHSRLDQDIYEAVQRAEEHASWRVAAQ